MAVENIYQGDDLDFSIERFEDDDETIPVNLNNYDNVIVYIYSNTTDKKLFTRETKAGYTALTVETAYKYTGKVPGVTTKTMKTGRVTLELWSGTGGTEKRIGKGIIYDLLPCEIKAES